ncbi:MAG: ribonuclease P protein component [SAR324 cluster bacterium]|nr:ribonuclease P protein component [SAR324 cluster bacterium]MBF0351515.1 ribonuclease P protein component [SAR324 cluster bacterium]
MKSFGFPKNIRLSRQNEIQAIWENGLYCRKGILGAKYLKNDLGYNRYLISIKKKVGSAPVRNLLKRLIREAIRLTQVKFQGGFDICLFITRPPQYSVTFATIQKSILYLFQQMEQGHASS